MARLIFALTVASLCFAAAGCRRDTTGTKTVRQPAAQSPAGSGWLSPLTEVHHQRLASAPGSVDLRQACYLRTGVLVLLRDRAAHKDGLADPQWLVQLDADGARRLPIEDGVLPTRLLPAPDRQRSALVCWPRVAIAGGVPPGPGFVGPVQPVTGAGPDYDWHQPLLGWYSGRAPANGSPLVQVVNTAGAVPVQLGAGSFVYLRRLGSAAIMDGLPVAQLAWSASASTCQLRVQAPLTSVDDPALLASPLHTMAAGLAPASDGVPAWQCYLWRKGQGLRSQRLTELPVMPGSVPDDIQSLGWVNEAILAVALPAPAGTSDANWSLEAIHTADGSQTLVADHLPPATPVTTTDGLLFYCLPAAGTSDSYELWGASPDGLAKRRLAAYSDTVHLELTEAFQGRLLLLRQPSDSAVATGAPRAELIELAISTLSPWKAPADALVSPNAPAHSTPVVAGHKSHPRDAFIPDNKLDEAGSDDNSGLILPGL